MASSDQSTTLTEDNDGGGVLLGEGHIAAAELYDFRDRQSLARPWRSARSPAAGAGSGSKRHY